jgi:integrase
VPGSIRRRGQSWTVTVDLGRDPGSGQRRQVFRTTRTKREAETLLVQLLHERDNGLERSPGRQTLGQYLERWLVDYVALLARNPADAVQRPNGPRRELLAISAAEVLRLLSAADETPIGSLVRMAVMTGMRRSELLGLRWRDVDLDGGVASVQQTAQRISSQGWIFQQPKTRLSRRAIALSPSTVQTLRRHRRQQAEARLLAGPAYRDRDLVFASALGTPVEPGTIARTWARVLDTAGVGHVRWHDLRHAHATLLLTAGVHPKIVSERLGHASVGITLDTYSHVLPGLQVAAAAQLDTLLADPPEALPNAR